MPLFIAFSFALSSWQSVVEDIPLAIDPVVCEPDE
jgi:hypothetical protein